MDTNYSDGYSPNVGAWSDLLSSSFTRVMGLSFFASLFSHSYLFDSAKLLILGSIIETGRRLCQWLIERFRFQYSMTAQFDEGDPAYEWIVLFLTQENVWRQSRDFRVSAKNSKRRWSVKAGSDSHPDGNADYVPTYELPQLFRWKGYWLEIKRYKGVVAMSQYGGQTSATIYVTIYTLNMSVLSALVEEARLRYIEVSRPNVIIHMADTPNYGPFAWNNVKRKVRRPLSSIILQEGIIESLIQDAQEFIDTEDWYIEAGIPHRRGYLLYGPPGTGKSSTIYALAGELGLEIYSLSLASGFVDDSFLQRAASSIPKQSILLIEDIDCAFPSREEVDEEINMMSGFPAGMPAPYIHPIRKSAVTLSGLLNVIDGVGSEEGKLFFATTNYIDRLDPALLRPGRIDRKVAYSLATRGQAYALFTRFFPSSRFGHDEGSEPIAKADTFNIHELANIFADAVPEHEFSTAELQGYLLTCRKEPAQAAKAVGTWVEHERAERQEREEREEKRREKIQEAKDRREASQLQGAVARMGALYPSVVPGSFISGGPQPTSDLPEAVAHPETEVNGTTPDEALLDSTSAHGSTNKVDHAFLFNCFRSFRILLQTRILLA
ncbi:P-loop containing nucleoside triphosphate hydrolase protein [Infundibulicybe gibba]|nr:P-loop containing nucleoside triphosphate hydrolase protein [Infundibulicybe gibba]